MHSLLFTLSILPLITSATPLPDHKPNVRPRQGYGGGYGGESQQEARQRAAAVQQVFQTAWDGYYKYAFPNDELLPETDTYGNSRNGWGASAIDAFSTAIIMQNKGVVDEILGHIPNINWTVSYEDESVSLFETTIRYIGGLLSGFDLLSGPSHELCDDTEKLSGILQQAVNLANNLSFAFETSTGIPYNNLFVSNRSNDGSTTNGLATIGSLVLEWTHLADLTGNATYAALTQKAESYLLDPQPASAEPFPGLVGTNVNISNGMFIDASGGWNGGDDSFYEYLIKMYVYDQSRFASYKDRWILAADSSMQYLASHPTTRPDLTFLAAFTGEELVTSSGHLACFDGGNFILGGLVLNEQKYVDFGLSLVAACEDTYNSTLTGIGPESFAWNPSNTTTLTATQQAFYDKAGFYITSSQYILRPEVLESFYYAYRATGDRKYQDWSWNGFQAIANTTRVGSGYSEISDVNAPGGGSFLNFQDSFFFAEVLKYSYLIHSSDADAGGSSGQLTSLVITQLNILLSTIKDDGDLAKWQTQVEKIQKLVDENGMEVFAQYFRRLLTSSANIVFTPQGRAPPENAASGNYQLLVKEVQKLLEDSAQAYKIADALSSGEGDLYRDFDLSTFVAHLIVHPIARIALLLALRNSPKADLRSKADVLLNNSFQSFLTSLSQPGDGPDIPPTVLASILDSLIQDPPRNWSEDQRVNLFYAVRVRYTRLNSRIPVVIEATMCLHDILNSPEGRLARHVQKIGPKGTSSLEACKEMLSTVETRDISYSQIGNAILYAAIAKNGVEFDLSIFVEAVRQHRAGPGIDWTDVVTVFDKEGLRVTKKHFLSLYNALVPLAREHASFDVQTLWGGSWQYQETQLSFVVAFLSTTAAELDVTRIPRLRPAFTQEDFSTASDEVKAFAAQAVKHPLVSADATETLFTMIFRSQDTYVHAQNLDIPDTLINPNMTIFIVAASAVPKPWAALQEQALKQLFFPFLLKHHDDYDFVMHALWRNDKSWVAARMVEFVAQDAMLLVPIFEHAQEHGWLDLLLTIQSSFVVDLATYAHGQEACDLEQWAQGHVEMMGPAPFARALADFLQQKMEDEVAVQREHAVAKTVPLAVRTVYKLLTMIEDSLPDQELSALQRQCLQVYPRLINYGEDEKRDAVIEANARQSHSLPDDAGSQMEEQYKKMYGGGVDANDIINDLKRLKTSEVPADQDLFAAMIHGLFDEYNCFGEYPNEALATTAVLFGGLVKYDVLTGPSAQVALYMVFEAVMAYGPEDSMWKFGMQALLHFTDRLKDWPHLAERILQIPSLRGTQVIPTAEKVLKELQHEDPTMNGDLNGLTHGGIDDEFPADSPTPPFSCIHIDPPLHSEIYEQPNEETSDKVIFVLNNMSKRNFEEKFKELQSALETRHHQWFAHYLVEELAKSQPNFQALYLQLLEHLNQKVLWAEILRETYISCAKMLNAQSTLDSTQERTSLKNLAAWLGSLTLARNQPVLHRNISFKDLLLEAHDTQRLIVAIPFTCKVLIQAANSKVFRPPNPWLMELLGFLSELYHFMELKLNLKFEIEVLCKDLHIDINKIEPLDVIRSRPMLHENNLLQQYLPDSSGDGFGDMHLMGLAKRASGERFSPDAVIQALPDLGNLLQIPQAAGNVTQLQLRTIFINAAQQAIYEIIAPVVERSVTIAAISTAELIQKDFATESDVDKMRNAAHTMVRALSGSLALVTCKEPLRMSTTNNIRILAARNLSDQLPEGQILMFVNDNIETVCNLVERAAEEHSIREADAQLARALELRKQHNEERPNEAFNNPPINRWAQLIPEPYRQEIGGLNRQQLTLYEDFGRQARMPPTATGVGQMSQDASRQLPDVLNDSYLPSLPTPAEAPALPRIPEQQRMRNVPTPGQVNGYADPANIGQTIRNLLESLQMACRDAPEDRITEISESAPVRRYFEELINRVDTSVQKDTLALAAGQETLLRAFSEAQKRLEVEVLIRLVEQLCRMSNTAQRNLTHWLATFDNPQMFNCPVVVALLNEHLLQLEQIDIAVAKALKDRSTGVLGFLKDLTNELVLRDSQIAVFRADFALTYDALSQWVAEDCPNLGREILQRLQFPADHVNGMPSPPESTKQDQLEYIFEEWLRLQQKNLPARAEVAFVQQLFKQHIVSTQDESAVFIRTCLNMCVTAAERAAATPYITVEASHFTIDAFAKLIAQLFVHNMAQQGSKASTSLQSILVVVVLVFNEQYHKLRERFPGRVYFRFFSTLLYDIHNLRERFGEEMHTALLHVFAELLLCLQPKFFEGFCFCWLTLLTHRLFLPNLLRGSGRSNGGWEAALGCFDALFIFFAQATRQADVNANVREFYQGVGRIMTMLHRDFPEFLIENHARLNGYIPDEMAQLHNVVNSVASHAVLAEQPDPFERGLKINRLDQTRQQPAVFADLGKMLTDAGIMITVSSALGGEISSDKVDTILAALQQPDGSPDFALSNYLILYLGVKATSASSVYTAAGPEARLIDRLLQDSGSAVRYGILSAMTSQLRYVNAHTHYFSTALTHTFSISSEEIQQQIITIFVKRLAVPRPHPWGLIISVLEIIKNSTSDLWSLPWVKTQPQVENILLTIAQYQ
ncbi:hypothetical protein AMS68_000598 [Peltaster fructicola]|uniref:alpha-1,2-Mannosidase n=1 Tax=Peltaster fructicola TaxID=286661 RepID=A0A6H0XKC1_9PEZI|nr:hypothetical protein AMS68_000598 [Peltaster fructicola]